MIKHPFNLSLQRKIPLWGGVLIVISTLSVSGLSMYRAYYDLKEVMVASSKGLGQSLSKTLTPSLLRDDVWRVFEIIRAPFADAPPNTGIRPDVILVVSTNNKVVVSSDPERFPMLSEIGSFGGEFPPFFSKQDHPLPLSAMKIAILEPDGARFIYVTVPIEDEGAFLGTLVLRHPRSSLNASFRSTAAGGAVLGLVVLAVLLPVSWYWGQRMALPLVDLAERMGNIKDRSPERFEMETYGYNDELGRMFAAYNAMVGVLKGNAVLEKEIAIERLTAGIAHEINNPLSGMVTALDTLKRRRDIDERTLKTVGLVERGLFQIRDTVVALIAETSPGKRELSTCDIDDIRALLHHEVSKKRIKFDFETTIHEPLPFPAGVLRQIIINILHNAVKAAGERDGGWVRASIGMVCGSLEFRVSNNGESIPSEHIGHLFEPFVSYRKGGYGLGLWVTGQLVNQLDGRIEVINHPHEVEFLVQLPIPKGEEAA